jgi:NAD(P)-dependent dehydrogenase (short-subunit alcohol dehydrogenase family)
VADAAPAGSLGAHRTAVVTGGASGIGRSCAVAFAHAGCDVAVADLHEARLAETRAEIEALGRRCVAVRCDVRSDDDMAAFAAAAHDALGPIDIAMFNAGFSVLGPPDLVPVEAWQRQMDVNFFGVVRGVNAFVPAMRAAGRGHVVITASIAGRYAYSYDAGPYIASKFATYGYAENLALYLRPQGVEVSVLCPGLVLTNLGENAERAGVAAGAAWGHFPEWMLRPITPDDVASMVLDAIRERRFLIYTHPEDEVLIRERSADVDAALTAQIARLPDPTPPAG